MANNPDLDDRDLFQIQIHEKNFTDAIKTAGRIINDLEKKNRADSSNKKLLIIYVIKRIKLNFDARQYEDVIKDCLLLETMGEDINKQKDIFLMKEQSLMEKYLEETGRRFRQVQIELNNDRDIVYISSKIQEIDIKYTFTKEDPIKPNSKKQKFS